MDKRKKMPETSIAEGAIAFQNEEKKKLITRSKEDEEHIGHLVAILESPDDAIISKTLDGIIKSWNKGSEKMFGYTSKDAIGKHISLIIPRQYVDEAEKIIEKIRSNKIVDNYETIRNKKNGEQFYVSLTFSPIKDRNGIIIGVSKILRDIASQKKNEAELVLVTKELVFQNEEKEKRAAELIIANRELAFQNEEKENRAAELIIANRELAFQNKEKENRAAELIIANRELAFQNEEKEKREAELIIANKELAFQNVEKEKRATELIIANRELAFQNEEKEKRANELIIANRELAFQNEEKEKRAAEAVIANKELAFQNGEKGKRAGELIIVNKELAFQNEEKEKRAAELIIANEKLAFQNEEKENRAAELVIANRELLFQNEKKEKRATELIIANKELAFQNEEKEKREDELIIANRELAFQNEEKEKRADELIIINKELKNAEDELGSFSYSVSHDLRAPIRAINGYAKILEEDYAEKFDSDGTRALNSIMSNSKKMGQLIDDLLAFSRLGRKQVTVSELNMNILVTSIRKELLSDSNKSRTIFNVNMLPDAKGDHSLINQVWINLISNAIKYSKNKPQSTIEIGASEKDNLVVYYIKDNGAGFDMQYYDKLFGVFQRLHSQEEFEGTGIGLAIVQKIVHRHGGTVWAESKLNEGTTFYFSLPSINF